MRHLNSFPMLGILSTYLLKLPFISAVLLFVGSTAFAQQGPVWKQAALSGTPYLYRTALAAERPRGSAEALRALDESLGWHVRDGRFFYARSPKILLTPELGYDTNFNGGFGADQVRLGNAILSVTPETRARPSYYVGSALSIGQTYVVGRGKTITANLRGTYRRSVSESLNHRFFSLGICARNQFDTVTGADFCLRRTRNYRELGNSTVDMASFGFSRIFIEDDAINELSFTIGREFRNQRERSVGSITYQRLDRRHGMFKGTFFLGEKIMPLSTTTRSLDLEHGRFVNDQFFKFSIGLRQEEGGVILGRSNKKTEYSARLTLPEIFGVIPEIGYVKQAHDLPEFDRGDVVFSLSLPAFRF